MWSKKDFYIKAGPHDKNLLKKNRPPFEGRAVHLFKAIKKIKNAKIKTSVMLRGFNNKSRKIFFCLAFLDETNDDVFRIVEA